MMLIVKKKGQLKNKIIQGVSNQCDIYYTG